MAELAGIAASGHEETSKAAARLLDEQGNAFDAVLGAMCVACVSEPMLASLGGGGFLMAQEAGQPSVVHDFFVQTPRVKRRAEELDFYPILADFGTARQEFHIGMGSIAVPGVVAGLFEIHRRYCRLPISEIMAPAVELARAGVRVNRLQHYISHILLPILQASPEAMRLVATAEAPGEVAAEGETVTNPELADALEALAREGPDLFYQGEMAQQLVRDNGENGGMLSARDLAEYTVIRRQPVRYSSHGADFSFNSPPSPSGCLVAFALGLLAGQGLSQRRWGHAWHCASLGRAMQAADRLRRSAELGPELSEERVAAILGPQFLQDWRSAAFGHDTATRGTTHISVADAQGNLASLTISNGEGCAYVLPGTGIMLNNMLGEEDLNPQGFHRWRPGARMASMMCPAVASLPDGGWVALGSGGSNRIRSAILQVLLNRFEFGHTREEAVAAPRMHLEGAQLSLEAGFAEEALEALGGIWPDHRLWPEPNIFFGGVHAVERMPDGSLCGAGDPRRGGAVATAGRPQA
ncbi:MAG TPA: gamma-glutamyltransferase [Xanthomonadales bacterium]|nr:gamma-glutamyltransferase [Xanthomonadales bacterium]